MSQFERIISSLRSPVNLNEFTESILIQNFVDGLKDSEFTSSYSYNGDEFQLKYDIEYFNRESDGIGYGTIDSDKAFSSFSLHKISEFDGMELPTEVNSSYLSDLLSNIPFSQFIGWRLSCFLACPDLFVYSEISESLETAILKQHYSLSGLTLKLHIEEVPTQMPPQEDPVFMDFLNGPKAGDDPDLDKLRAQYPGLQTEFLNFVPGGSIEQSFDEDAELDVSEYIFGIDSGQFLKCTHDKKFKRHNTFNYRITSSEQVKIHTIFEICDKNSK